VEFLQFIGPPESLDRAESLVAHGASRDHPADASSDSAHSSATASRGVSRASTRCERDRLTRCSAFLLRGWRGQDSTRRNPGPVFEPGGSHTADSRCDRYARSPWASGYLPDAHRSVFLTRPVT